MRNLLLTLVAAAAFDSRDVPAAEWVCGAAASLTVTFNDGIVARGCMTPEVLRPATVAMPTLRFYDAAAPPTQLYTALVIDRDAPNATVPLRGPLRHMALAGLSQAQLSAGVSWATLGPFNNGSAVALFTYSGPNPPAGSSCHRYYVFLYAQTAGVTPDIPQSQAATRFSWDFPSWATSQQLTKIASATTYFRTQNWDNYTGPCDAAPPSSSGLSSGAAVGIAVAAVAGVGVVGAAVVVARRRRAPPTEADRDRVMSHPIV